MHFVPAARKDQFSPISLPAASIHWSTNGHNCCLFKKYYKGQCSCYFCCINYWGWKVKYWINDTINWLPRANSIFAAGRGGHFRLVPIQHQPFIHRCLYANITFWHLFYMLHSQSLLHRFARLYHAQDIKQI